MKQYSRVSYEVRCQIVAYLEIGFSIPVIASRLGFHKTTIYRELNRNAIGRCRLKHYDAQAAELKTLRRTRHNHRKAVIQKHLKKVVVARLHDGWSPMQIAKRLCLEKKAQISHETIYRFVRKNSEYKHTLRWAGRRGIGRYCQRKNNLSGKIMIHQRPPIANRRGRIGDWERDTMYGANRRQLLICTDRKSRLTLIKKLPQIDSKTVNEQTVKILNHLGRKVFTVTNDNGTEFRKKMSSHIRVFYCDPLRPQQRGTVEHMIGDLRRWIHRDTDLEKLSSREIKRMERLLNKRPRKCLDYLTPYEVFYNKKVALVS